jgi:hypothetical protein
MALPARPIPESYWVEPQRFLAGEHPAALDLEIARRRMDAFLEAGFTDFIDLTQPNEFVPYEHILKEQARACAVNVSYKRMSIRDYGIPSRQLMTQILDSIDESLAAGRKVYLHCWGGVGRTGTVVGCYLVRHGKSGEQALQQLAAWWQFVPKRIFHPRTPESDEQMDFIRSWYEIPPPSHRSRQRFCEG